MNRYQIIYEGFYNKRKLSLFSILMTVILSSTLLGGCALTTKTATTTPLTTVRLNEVARSVFYAAMNLDYFKDQVLTIDLTTGQGADATTPLTHVLELHL